MDDDFLTDGIPYCGVIDVGSNSVRLMLCGGGRSVEKTIVITKLAKGMAADGFLGKEAVQRTAEAVCSLCEKARLKGVLKLYAFATAAVRGAKNGKEFVSLVKKLCGLDIEILSGQAEAEVSYLGAFNGKDGGLIDVGGGSTEVNVVKNGVSVYCKSVACGCVKITDICGQDREKAVRYAEEIATDFADGASPESVYGTHVEFTAVGGTATSAASVLIGSEVYRPELVDGYYITKEKLISLRDETYALDLDKRRELKGLQKGRAEVFAGGLAVLCAVTERLNADGIRVSDKDNLEGYLFKKHQTHE